MDSRQISLSLVSHTNAGKTTLARTLLGRDVGEVRDAPHVTDFADAFTLIETPAGESLRLWDTPGFGDSLRLLRRLRLAGQPLGWFLSQVWDRWRDRPFWASQQALRNVRDEADVMLYLVNAAESPAAAGYVEPEMHILAWVDKPVIVLLNQLGAPRAAAAEAAELQGWRDRLAAHPQVVDVLPFDAFARCWVQEFTLLAAVQAALSFNRESLSGDRATDLQALMSRLRTAWAAGRWATFDAAMQSLSRSLGRLANDAEALPGTQGGDGDKGFWTARLGRVAGALRSAVANANAGGRGEDRSPAAVARLALAQRLATEVQASTGELIALHRLEGRAEADILTRLATQFETRSRVDEGRAALWGGAVTGAIAGLKADILSGGLTMGGGLLAGGVLGALGAAGLARSVNLVRGTDRTWVAWTGAAIDGMVDAALLRYLAVAHFGRGRGDWAAGESPPHWPEVVAAALAPEREGLQALWAGRDLGRRHPPGWANGASLAAGATAAIRAESMANAEAQQKEERQRAMTAAIELRLRRAALRALQRLYPEVPELADAAATTTTGAEAGAPTGAAVATAGTSTRAKVAFGKARTPGPAG